MSAAGRQALWDREKAEPKPGRSRLPSKRAAQPCRKGYFVVNRVNDDGRVEVVRAGISYEDADRIAGQMRDRSTDRELLDGWNYLPGTQPRAQAKAAGTHSLPFASRR